MEYRPLPLAALLIALCGSAPAVGEDGGRDASQQQRLDRAAALKADAAARRERARLALEKREAECARRFFVNSCREDAQAEHLQATLEARQIENDGEALEHQVKREEAAEREAQRAAAASRREAELETREPEVAAKRQEAAEAAARRQADKEKKAAAGTQRKAAEAKKQRQKQAAHEARIAKKKQGKEPEKSGREKIKPEAAKPEK